MGAHDRSGEPLAQEDGAYADPEKLLLLHRAYVDSYWLFLAPIAMSIARFVFFGQEPWRIPGTVDTD